MRNTKTRFIYHGNRETLALNWQSFDLMDLTLYRVSINYEAFQEIFRLREAIKLEKEKPSVT